MDKTERDLLEHDAYCEQRFEMLANEIKPPTFAEWKRRNARIREFVRQQKKVKLRDAYGSASEAARGVADGGSESFE